MRGEGKVVDVWLYYVVLIREVARKQTPNSKAPTQFLVRRTKQFDLTTWVSSLGLPFKRTIQLPCIPQETKLPRLSPALVLETPPIYIVRLRVYLLHSLPDQSLSAPRISTRDLPRPDPDHHEESEDHHFWYCAHDDLRGDGGFEL